MKLLLLVVDNYVCVCSFLMYFTPLNEQKTSKQERKEKKKKNVSVFEEEKRKTVKAQSVILL